MLQNGYFMFSMFYYVVIHAILRYCSACVKNMYSVITCMFSASDQMHISTNVLSTNLGHDLLCPQQVANGHQDYALNLVDWPGSVTVIYTNLHRIRDLLTHRIIQHSLLIKLWNNSAKQYTITNNQYLQ